MDWNRGLGLGIGDWNSYLGVEIRLGNGLGIWNRDRGLGLEIGDWGLGIGDRYWSLGLRDLDWYWGFRIRIGDRDC